jgi:hypothetical protein
MSASVEDLSMCRSVLLSLLALVAIIGFCGEASAFGGNVTGGKTYMQGTARVAELRGTFTLAANEQLTNVRMIAYDAQGRQLSAAQGTWNSTTRTWSAAVGDFRMAYYQVEFTVRIGNTTKKYYTLAYRW